ncbi:unnamed protein product [Hydatigera taeniaeformis]|uniref:G_PROTEIN_RECEP_F1_2 domain-containing protein n=1 Tax=Hydatigena taeniaeformis TaxID=6205 RepID=A0A0R3WLE0_HYDTA|nr:unnamed protein product [Hydatigera taeniaeformis]
MLVKDSSESFWLCMNTTNTIDALDIVIFITELLGLLPGVIVAVLLCRVDGKTRTSLLMLRTLSICSVLQLIINLLGDIYPHQIRTGNYGFNIFLCVVWTSRFSFWIFAIIGAHALIYFSTNRTIQIVANLQLSFASSRNIDLVYIAGLTLYSAIITVPQVFTLNYDGDRCYCDEALMRLSFLQLAYAEVYIFFVQVLLVNSLVLLISCCLIIKWVKKTPREKFMDTLNTLSFPNTPEQELKAYSEMKGWSTSTMCIVPMFVSYVIAFSYDLTYQFISAVGFTQYPINGYNQKIGVWIQLLHPMLIPYFLFYYIPALRFWLLKRWRWVVHFYRQQNRQHPL